MLRDLNKGADPEEATTSGTRTNKLDKYFKYSLIKRKREAFVSSVKDDEYSPPREFSSTGDHELDNNDDSSSSYISGSFSRKRNKGSKRNAHRMIKGKRNQKLTLK